MQWTVKGSDGKQVSQVRPLTDSGVALAAPIAAGDVQIEAAIVDRGRVVHKESAAGVTVATYTPTPTPTPVFTPTPVASPTPNFAQMSITGGPVNVRSGPGTGYGKIGDAQDGAIYRITGKNEAGDWYQFSFGEDQPGWVSARFATVAGPTEALAIVKPAAPAPVAAAAPAASQPAAAPAGPSSERRGLFRLWYAGRSQWWAHESDSPVGHSTGSSSRYRGRNLRAARDPRASLMVWVNEAKANGLNVMASIVKAPAWARNPSYGLRGEGPPQNPADYADYVGAFAAHFCGKVQAIEVWNEQNMDYEWGYEPLDPARYMELLKLAYASIKANCPAMIVVSGAPTPAGMVLPNAYDDREYLRGMYRNGLARYADAIGVHPSGFGNSPDVTVQDFQAGRYSAPSHVNHSVVLHAQYSAGLPQYHAE